MKALQVLLTTSFLFAGTAMAQQAAAPPPPGAPGENAIFITGGPAHGEFLFVERMDRHVVKGAPYSATASTESTQVLPDGNRIVHKQSGLVARDSEGRTRREETMDRMGPLAMQGNKMVFINDPVANTSYMLNPDKQTARVMKHNGPQGMEMQQLHRKMQAGMAGKENQADVKTESLGTQQIEGVTAEGKLVTRTIPAGAIGNEQPIVITVETWTSPDLHTLLLQKRNDPRFGETVFRLTNIKQGQPDPSLFQVPSNYKTLEGPAGMRGPMMPPPPPAPAQ